MVQVNYNHHIDELEVVFENVDIPEVVRLDSGVMLEFGNEKLSAIILPNFLQMIHRPPQSNLNFEFVCFKDDFLKIKVEEQIINVKIDLEN